MLSGPHWGLTKGRCVKKWRRSSMEELDASVFDGPCVISLVLFNGLESHQDPCPTMCIPHFGGGIGSCGCRS